MRAVDSQPDILDHLAAVQFNVQECLERMADAAAAAIASSGKGQRVIGRIMPTLMPMLGRLADDIAADAAAGAESRDDDFGIFAVDGLDPDFLFADHPVFGLQTCC